MAEVCGFTSHQSPVTSHEMTFADAKQRFSNRAADYVRYRPGYPSELLDVLRKRPRRPSQSKTCPFGTSCENNLPSLKKLRM